MKVRERAVTEAMYWGVPADDREDYAQTVLTGFWRAWGYRLDQFREAGLKGYVTRAVARRFHRRKKRLDTEAAGNPKYERLRDGILRAYMMPDAALDESEVLAVVVRTLNEMRPAMRHDFLRAGDTSPARVASGGETLSHKRVLSAVRGDRFVRWTALATGARTSVRIDAEVPDDEGETERAAARAVPGLRRAA